MHIIWQNLRFSLRMLRKDPGLTLTVLLTLALGIGANTAIFTVIYASLLAPLPYPYPEQLVIVWSKVQGHRNGVSAGDYLDWKQQNTIFEDLNAWTGGDFNIATKDKPEYVEGRMTTPGLNWMLGNGFTFGRDFVPEEGQPGKDHVVILTHKLWQRLGSNPHIIGTTIRLDDQPYTVVGVFAPGLTDRGQGELVIPLTFKPEQLNHDFHWILVMGRLKPGMTIQQAQADMDSVTKHIAEIYPTSNKGWGASVEPFKNDFIPRERVVTSWLLLAAVGFVLLIACANVANLLLARSLARQKEMAVRSALGASRKTIFGQLLTESLFLATIGGLMGLALGYALLRGLVAAIPPNTLPSEAEISLNIPVLIFTLLATTTAGLLFGCAPAWYASRIDPGETLKEGGRSGTGAGRHRLRRTLVTAEFALALALLAGAGLAIHSFWNLMRVDLGVQTDHILTFFLPVPDSRPKDPERIVAYYREILAKIEAVPGVSDAAVTTGTPLEGAGFGMPFTIEGNPNYADLSQRPGTAFGMISPDFFQTFGVRIVQGRSLNEQDVASSVKVAVVNEDFVGKYLKGTDPLRQRIVVEQLIPGVQRLGPPIEWQIVGVYHTVRSRGLREDNPEMLLSFWQVPWPRVTIGVRTQQDPTTMVSSITAAVHSVDPTVALAGPRSMEQVRDDVLASDRFAMILFASFAAAALLLAAVGVYGVMSFSVAQRSHEIAICIALGASRNRVVADVIKEGVLLACIGLGLGLIGALFEGHAMASMLYGVRALDISAFLAVALVLLSAALLACYLPARRAAGLEPMQALRTE